MPDLLLVLAALIGAAVQATVGFGYAFFAAPAAFAVYQPEPAVALLLGMAIVVNGLVLLGERRNPEVEYAAAVPMLVAAVPGVAAGVVVLGAVDADHLQVAVGALILFGVVAQARRSARQPDVPPSVQGHLPLAVGAGLTAGVLTTSASITGPVVVLALTHEGGRGKALRDTLAFILLGLSILGAIALAVSGADTSGIALADVLVIGAALLIGLRIGAVIFARLPTELHYRLVLVAAAIAAALSLLSGLT